MPEYLTSGDAAKETGLTGMGIKAAANRGDLPVAAITRGGIRLFKAEDVQRFKQDREQNARRNSR
jgi:DNA-binding transcriptional MerR regulator